MRKFLVLFTLLLIATIPADGQSSTAQPQNSAAPMPSVGGLRNLATLRDGVKRGRVSSYDPTGANNERLENIAPGKRITIADVQGAGTITHL